MAEQLLIRSVDHGRGGQEIRSGSETNRKDRLSGSIEGEGEQRWQDLATRRNEPSVEQSVRTMWSEADRLLMIALRLAGSDTTAISLRSCFYYIVKTPQVYQTLVAEIDEADRNRKLSPFVTYEECLKLPYL